MVFCQFVVGAPGSGKSTYCHGMQQFMRAIGREAVLVNLDPANEDLQYSCAVNITDLITVEDAMKAYGLGPNGALMYCMSWLDENMDLLKQALAPHEGKYILFDFPGQAELYTHNSHMRSIVDQIKKWDYLPVVVNLLDSHLCTSFGNHFGVKINCSMYDCRLSFSQFLCRLFSHCSHLLQVQILRISLLEL